MAEYSLDKTHKLCSGRAIDRLFAEGKSQVAYPLRMVYAPSMRREGRPVQFMITIPKKRIRKAVGRVLMRRRIREAMRLSMPRPDNRADERHVQLAIIYVADRVLPYTRVLGAVKRILAALPPLPVSPEAAAEDGDK